MSDTRLPARGRRATRARTLLALLCLASVVASAACGERGASTTDREAQLKTSNAPSPAVAPEAAEAAPAAMSAPPAAPGMGTIGRFADEDGARGERYDGVEESPYLEAARVPLSTFSIDVDTASYSNVRRFISDGSLPPRDAVRVEELINYFSYDYPQPVGDAPFAVAAEVAECPWNPRHRLLHIGVQGRRMASEDLPPCNLVFLVDVSGSMGSNDKLPLLKQSLAVLVERLTARDRVAIVTYAGSSGLALPSTSGDSKREILDAVERLQAGGSTNGEGGIRLAYQIAEQHFSRGGINRVILATDGDFNVGVSSDQDLVRLVEEKRRTGVFLTVLGFGTGNLNDSAMEKLADKGNGNYAYIDGIDEGRKVLGSEIGATLVTIAKDVKVQVEFNPAQVAAYRLVGYENRALADRDFNDDSKDAGEIGAGHSVTALYEIVPYGQASEAATGVDPLRYQRPATRAGSSRELMTVKLRYKEPDGEASKLVSMSVVDRGASLESASESFRFSSAVAAFGLLLRGSQHKGSADFGAVLDLARSSLGADLDGHRAEFVSLVERARGLGDGVNR
jgi:Ca-activated chloride channel family protein